MDASPASRLWAVMSDLKKGMAACAAIPRKPSARLRTRLLRIGREDVVDLIAELHTEEAAVAAKLRAQQERAEDASVDKQAPGTAASGSAAHSHAPVTARSETSSGPVGPPGTGLRSRGFGKPAEATIHQRRIATLVRAILRAAQGDRACMEFMRETTQAQLRSSEPKGGLGGARRTPVSLAIDTSPDSSAPLPEGAGLAFVQTLLVCTEEVLQDRLTHSDEDLRKRRTDIADGKASVDRLTKQLAVEETECARLRKEHSKIVGSLRSSADHLSAVDATYKALWREQQMTLAEATSAMLAQDRAAHDAAIADLAAAMDAASAALEKAQEEHSAAEATARIRRKRAALEVAKLTSAFDERLLSLLQREDALKAEVSDQELQIAALTDYVSAVDSESSKRGEAEGAFEAKRHKQKRREWLLRNGAARVIQKNLRIKMDAIKAERKAAKKSKKSKKR